MALNGAQRTIIQSRRALVARLRLQGKSQRDIVAAFVRVAEEHRATGKPPLPGALDADGKPWSIGTVNSDCKALEKEWRQEAAKEIALHKGRLLARLDALYEKAWADGNIEAALKVIDQQRRILGVDAPTKVANTDPTGEHQAPSSVIMPAVCSSEEEWAERFGR